jgi:RecB family exonuclease
LRLDAAHLPSLAADSKERKALLRDRHLAQERRTAYVAVTRARRRLVMTGAAWYDGKRPKDPSELLELAKGQRNATVIEWCQDPGKAPVDRPSLADAPDPHLPEGWRSALRATLGNPAWPAQQTDDITVFEDHRQQLEFMLDQLPEPPPPPPPPPPSTSVTGLVTLASCPQRFYWSEIDRLPRRPSPWLLRGTALHRRIELHHQGIAALDLDEDHGVPPDETAPHDGVDAFAGFTSSRFAQERPILVEAPLDLTVGETRIRGRIDAVYEPSPGTWEIVDYKSGRRREDPAALVQLQAYAVAVDAGAVVQQRPENLRVTFVYFGTDPPEEVSLEVSTAWLAEARNRITSLAAAAAGDTFAPQPSPGCRRCDFLNFCEAGRRWTAAADSDPAH